MLVEIALGVAVVALLLWMVFGRPSGLPPGRWGYPLFGHLPLDGRYIDFHLEDLHKKYGDIYIWRFGIQLQVYVHDYNLCREIFASQDFVDRGGMDFLKFGNEEMLGIASSNGAIWHTNRRFALRHLKDLGMGKSDLISAIHAHALNLIEAVKESAGKAEPITPALFTSIINIIWKMAANTEFEADDKRHQDYQKLMDQINITANYAPLADMLPWTKYVVPSFITRRLFQLDKLDNILRTFFNYFDELIEEHQQTLDPTNPRDVIDAYLIDMNEMEKRKIENDETTSSLRSVEDLKFLILDLFSAGSDTTHTTMKWIFLYMAAYPGMQRKMQQEIDEVLPKGIMVTLEDKASLPYTEAVIHEVLRKSSLANIGFHHAATRDVVIAGYKIPKGTLVTSATAMIHHDPRYWDKPDHFLPGRWLSPEGKFVMKKEGFLPFGIGKRRCIGESLTQMELLVFTTAVFQNFSIAPPEGKLVDLLPDYDVMLSHNVRNQDVVFTIRK